MGMGVCVSISRSSSSLGGGGGGGWSHDSMGGNWATAKQGWHWRIHGVDRFEIGSLGWGFNTPQHEPPPRSSASAFRRRRRAVETMTMTTTTRRDFNSGTVSSWSGIPLPIHPKQRAPISHPPHPTHSAQPGSASQPCRRRRSRSTWSIGAPMTEVKSTCPHSFNNERRRSLTL